MPQEPDRRAQILQAAFDEFAAKGFRGATIKSIAAAAGVQSTALLYWYFPTKEALFQAVLEAHAPIVQATLDPAALFERPPEEVLPLFAHALFATAEQPRVRQLVQLTLGEAMRRPEVAEALVAAGPGRVLALLTAYLAHQIEAGRMRLHDTRSSARAFMGMLLPQVAGHVFLPTLLVDAPGDEEHIATVTGIFLRGLRPDP